MPFLFRWRSLERREPLQEIIKLTFPAVQTICNNLVNSDSIEAAEMLKLALKIYHSGIQVRTEMNLMVWHRAHIHLKLGWYSQMPPGNIFPCCMGYHVFAVGRQKDSIGSHASRPRGTGKISMVEDQKVGIPLLEPFVHQVRQPGIVASECIQVHVVCKEFCKQLCTQHFAHIPQANWRMD